MKWTSTCKLPRFSSSTYVKDILSCQYSERMLPLVEIDRWQISSVTSLIVLADTLQHLLWRLTADIHGHEIVFSTCCRFYGITRSKLLSDWKGDLRGFSISEESPYTTVLHICQEIKKNTNPAVNITGKMVNTICSMTSRHKQVSLSLLAGDMNVVLTLTSYTENWNSKSFFHWRISVLPVLLHSDLVS